MFFYPGDDRLGTEEGTFKYYLTRENFAQLALIFSEYEQLTGESFEEALEDEFSRHTEDAVLAIGKEWDRFCKCDDVAIGIESLSRRTV